jgi:hypothetical protein
MSYGIPHDLYGKLARWPFPRASGGMQVGPPTGIMLEHIESGVMIAVDIQRRSQIKTMPLALQMMRTALLAIGHPDAELINPSGAPIEKEDEP